MGEKLSSALAILESAAAYPPEGHPRRTEGGYPAEFVYDEFAYRRIVDTYRNALEDAASLIKQHCAALEPRDER